MENEAIDGRLIYDDFPPQEYKYFSRLCKLGYNNRHRGWAKELCEQLAGELKAQYEADCTERDRYLYLCRRIQQNIKAADMLICSLDKAKSISEKYDLALQALSRITNDEWLYSRNKEVPK